MGPANRIISLVALNRRHEMLEECLTSLLVEELGLVPERVANNIMQRFVVDGTTPLTLENMRDVAWHMVTDVLRSGEFRDLLRGSLAPHDAAAAVASQEAAEHGRPSWDHGGRFQLLRRVSPGHQP